MKWFSTLMVHLSLALLAAMPASSATSSFEFVMFNSESNVVSSRNTNSAGVAQRLYNAMTNAGITFANTNGLASIGYVDSATNSVLGAARGYTDYATNSVLGAARGYADNATNTLWTAATNWVVGRAYVTGPNLTNALAPYATATWSSNTFLALTAWQSWLGTNGLAATAGDNMFTGSNTFSGIYIVSGVVTNTVTNIITGGITNWVGGTGEVQAYDSFPDDPTVLGTNSVFVSEVGAGDMLRVSGTTNIIGKVLGVQDDVVLWTVVAPQNISSYWYSFDIGKLADLTNVVNLVTTNLGQVVFADGSVQTTAWSNSSAQIAPLGASLFDAIGSSATVQSNLTAYAQYGATQTWTAAQLHIATNTFDAITFVNGPLFAFAHTNLYAYTAPNGTALRSLYHSRMSSASPLTTNQLLALYALTPYDKPLGSAVGVIDSRPYAATNAPSLWVSGSNGVAGFWVLPNDIGGVDVGASRLVFTNASPSTVDIRTQQVAAVASLVCTVPGLSRVFSNVNGNLIGYLGGQVALATGSDNNGGSLTNLPASVVTNGATGRLLNGGQWETLLNTNYSGTELAAASPVISFAANRYRMINIYVAGGANTNGLNGTLYLVQNGSTTSNHTYMTTGWNGAAVNTLSTNQPGLYLHSLSGNTSLFQPTAAIVGTIFFPATNYTVLKYMHIKLNAWPGNDFYSNNALVGKSNSVATNLQFVLSAGTFTNTTIVMEGLVANP